MEKGAKTRWLSASEVMEDLDRGCREEQGGRGALGPLSGAGKGGACFVSLFRRGSVCVCDGMSIVLERITSKTKISKPFLVRF